MAKTTNLTIILVETHIVSAIFVENVNNINEKILDKITKTCTCKSISRAKIKESIKNGAHTVDEVSKDTGACTGSCHGFRCKSKIEDLIRDYSK